MIELACHLLVSIILIWLILWSPEPTHDRWGRPLWKAISQEEVDALELNKNSPVDGDNQATR